jgi:hypothetical protein
VSGPYVSAARGLKSYGYTYNAGKLLGSSCTWDPRLVTDGGGTKSYDSKWTPKGMYPHKVSTC